MPGFLITNMKYPNRISNLENAQYVFDEIKSSELTIQRNTLNKFLDDKAFDENDDCIIVTDGCIYNKTEMLNEYGLNSIFDLNMFLYNKFGEAYYDAFRGTFNGAYIDKNNKQIICFVDQIGDKPLFWYSNEHNYIISTNVNYIVDVLRCNNISYTLDQIAVYDMLTYGFMASDDGSHTMISEIRRLRPGKFLRINMSNGDTDEYQYHLFDNKPFELENINEDEIIEKIDELFRQAVKREYEKDNEYGLLSIASLSGGLDSRMTTWVSSALGYENLSLTFSQSGYLDETIAQEIAQYLNNEWLFKSLDDAKFLLDIDEIIEKNFGLGIYIGSAHGNSLNKIFNFTNYGLLHTGQVGDVIVSSFCTKSDAYTKPKEISKTHSMLLNQRLKKTELNNYRNKEMYLFYTRGIGALSSQLVHTNYTEVSSPFLDVDFLEYCLSIPASLRENHKLYYKWIINKYPEASKFKYEKINCKITRPEFIQKLSSYRNKIGYKFERLFKIMKKSDLNSSMNPFQYYYYSKNFVRDYFDSYFNENITNKIIDSELRNDLITLYTNDSVIGKTQVLTVLATIKLYFNV